MCAGSPLVKIRISCKTHEIKRIPEIEFDRSFPFQDLLGGAKRKHSAAIRQYHAAYIIFCIVESAQFTGPAFFKTVLRVEVCIKGSITGIHICAVNNALIMIIEYV